MASQMMDDCFERVKGDHRVSEWYYFGGMRGHHILSTESWDLVERWMPDLSSLPDNEMPGEIAFTNALVYLKMGNIEEADKWHAYLKRDRSDLVQMMAKMIDGYRAVVTGDVEAGLALLKEVSELEASRPFEFGPPSLVKPTHELYAEALAESGNVETALAQYAIAASRTPGRQILAKSKSLTK